MTNKVLVFMPDKPSTSGNFTVVSSLCLNRLFCDQPPFFNASKILPAFKGLLQLLLCSSHIEYFLRLLMRLTEEGSIRHLRL